MIDGHTARDLASVARDLARQAGTLALEGRRNAVVTGTTKSSPTDMVTVFDTGCEALIVEGLARMRPGDGIVGEEGSSITGTTGIVWHIDPIDGTSNFMFDLPTWAVSIGACDELGPVAGAVFIPVLDEMFVASRGSGAMRNDVPIRASACTDLATALVGTGFGYDADGRTAQARTMAGLIGRIRDVRRLGAASVDMCFVACGRLDAYYETGLHSWDLVAAQIIATEAGAQASDFNGGPVHPSNVVVAAPGVHPALVTLLGSTTVKDR